jgi:hypothetical protein
VTRAMEFSNPFRSFFMAGFESSTHRRHDNRRLDVIASTGHDRFAASDYAQIARHGLLTVRDAARWHLIERRRDTYDWTSFLPMVRAAQREGVQVIWNLCHYGYPDDVDIWSGEFVDRFSRFAVRVAQIVYSETGEVPFYCPINEISFWSWAGGEVAHMNPNTTSRGVELKRQLVRA